MNSLKIQPFNNRPSIRIKKNITMTLFKLTNIMAIIKLLTTMNIKSIFHIKQ